MCRISAKKAENSCDFFNGTGVPAGGAQQPEARSPQHTARRYFPAFFSKRKQIDQRTQSMKMQSAASHGTMLNPNEYVDAVRRIAKGDDSPVASPPKAEVESGATMIAKPFARLRRDEIFLLHTKICVYTILILNDYKDAERRSAKGDDSPVASPPKAEVEIGATMTAKPSARLRRGEIFLLHARTCF